jgi:hypothetical protein
MGSGDVWITYMGALRAAINRHAAGKEDNVAKNTRTRTIIGWVLIGLGVVAGIIAAILG